MPSNWSKNRRTPNADPYHQICALTSIWLLLSNPRESKIDSGGRLGDGSVEGGTGDTEANVDLLNQVFRSTAPQPHASMPQPVDA